MSRNTISLAGAGLLLAGLLVALPGPVGAQETGGTLTQGYWRNHPEAWPCHAMTLGGLGTWPTGAIRETGIAYASQLDAFNNGLSGVPHCEGGVVPPPPPPEE